MGRQRQKIYIKFYRQQSIKLATTAGLFFLHDLDFEKTFIYGLTIWLNIRPSAQHKSMKVVNLCWSTHTIVHSCNIQKETTSISLEPQIHLHQVCLNVWIIYWFTDKKRNVKSWSSWTSNSSTHANKINHPVFSWGTLPSTHIHPHLLIYTHLLICIHTHVHEVIVHTKSTLLILNHMLIYVHKAQLVLLMSNDPLAHAPHTQSTYLLINICKACC